MSYADTYLSKSELESLLSGKIDPVDVNKISSAYEMSENAHIDHTMDHGSPYFFHVTRVCKIIICELELYDTDVIIASLLHDIYQTTSNISREIITYNFGNYVAFLIELLNQSTKYLELYPDKVQFKESVDSKTPCRDYLVIWMAEHLDNFRKLTFDPVYNPIQYMSEVERDFFPSAEKAQLPQLDYLIGELKKERNKIVG